MDDHDAELFLNVDGSLQGRSFSANKFKAGGNGAVTHLNKGDRVYVQTGSHQNTYEIATYKTTFMGFLISVD